VVVVTDEEHAGRPGKRISIFLAVWNVHVNRSPAAGTITALHYQPGKFYAAVRAAASAQNEQNIFTIALNDGITGEGEIVCKQIAGYVARRVVAWKKAGDSVARGERIGLVRFGSRADVWLPSSAKIVVKPGDHVAGGSSILAFLPVVTADSPLRRDGRDQVQTQHADTRLMPVGLPKV
jgi:phosphatidylserine decarboxylase